MVKIGTILLLLAFATNLQGQLTYKKLFVDYDSARTYRNLKIIPIRQKERPQGAASGILTLSQAIKTGSVTISERGTAATENVHWLRVNNHSDRPLFIGAGEIITGGRQDRMVSKDTILEPMGVDQYFQTMCVEEGRWSDKEKKFVYGSYANPRLRKVLDKQKNQLLIWKEIYRQLEESRIQSPTLSYAARKKDKKFLMEDDAYMQFFKREMLEKDSTIVGIIAVSGSQILATEIYDKEELFYNQAESLLAGFIEDAVTKGSVPALPDDMIKTFMDKVLEDEFRQEQYCRKNGKLYRYKNRVIHVTAYPE